MTILSLAMIAMIIADIALIRPQPTWPFPEIPGVHIHLPVLNRISLHD